MPIYFSLLRWNWFWSSFRLWWDHSFTCRWTRTLCTSTKSNISRGTREYLIIAHCAFIYFQEKSCPVRLLALYWTVLWLPCALISYCAIISYSKASIYFELFTTYGFTNSEIQLTCFWSVILKYVKFRSSEFGIGETVRTGLADSMWNLGMARCREMSILPAGYIRSAKWHWWAAVGHWVSLCLWSVVGWLIVYSSN